MIDTLQNTYKERPLRHESDEKTWPDQQKDNDKEKYKDNDNDKYI